MGLFHKSLEDAEKAIKKGEKAKAERIINEHLNHLPDLIKDIENLKRLLEEYQRGISYSKDILNDNRPEESSKLMKKVEEKMTAIEHISDIIAKHVKKER